MKRGAVQKLAELAPLVALLLRRRPVLVLEIGTGRGGSLYAWCAAADDRASVISLDLPGGAFGPRYADEERPRIRGYARGTQNLHLIAADSHDLETLRQVKAILAGRPLDFLMIDGDHTYRGVRMDYELYAPLVRPGGLIALHDTARHTSVPECEVDRFWAEIRPSHASFEFEDPSDTRAWGPWGGVGVLEA